MKTRRALARILIGCVLTASVVALTGCPKDEEKPAAAAPAAGAPAPNATTPAPAPGALAASADTNAWEGKFYNAAEKMTIELKPSHVATMTVEGDPQVASITWETVAPDKIRVHMMAGVAIDMFKSEGNTLRDSDGAVWTKK